VDPQFEDIARVALGACQEHGFVLAGGNALVAHRIGDRVTHDVDLFTNVGDPEAFHQAVIEAKDAFEARGDAVRVARSDPMFVRLYVSPSEQDGEVMVEFGYDYRQFPAVTLDVGPVLDPRDALASKLCALYDRGEERDFIDVHRALEAGVVNSWAEAIGLADQQSATPPPREYVRQGLKQAETLDEGILRSYGLGKSEVERLQESFADGVAAVDRGDLAGGPHL